MDFLQAVALDIDKEEEALAQGLDHRDLQLQLLLNSKKEKQLLQQQLLLGDSCKHVVEAEVRAEVNTTTGVDVISPENTEQLVDTSTTTAADSCQNSCSRSGSSKKLETGSHKSGSSSASVSR